MGQAGFATGVAAGFGSGLASGDQGRGLGAGSGFVAGGLGSGLSRGDLARASAGGLESRDGLVAAACFKDDFGAGLVSLLLAGCFASDLGDTAWCLTCCEASRARAAVRLAGAW